MRTGRTLSQTAREEKVGRTTLYEAISQGKLRAVKRGKLTIITASAWQAYLESLPDAVGSGAIRPAPQKEAA